MTRFAMMVAFGGFVLAGATALQAETLTLTLVDGAPPAYAATVNLDTPDAVFGRGPCNRYSARLTGDLPAFRPEPIIATRMACPDLAAEQQFFVLLGQMEMADQQDGMLTLTGGEHVLVFSRLP